MRWGWMLLLYLHLTLGFSELDEKCLDIEEVTPKKYFRMNGTSLTINLETSSRITHQLSTHVFYIYIKEVLGYSKIKITSYEDNFQIESSIERLSDYVDVNVSIPPATVNLEVWASPDYDTFAKEMVKECGSLAPPGRFGWFIPVDYSNPVKEYYQKYCHVYWDKSVQELHWSFFMNRDLVRNFDIDKHILDSLVEANSYNREPTGEYFCPTQVQTDGHYCFKSMYTPTQCANQTCAILLAPQYEATKFLINQIEETKLLVKVMWLGNNLKKALLDLQAFYSSNSNSNSNKGILIFNWFPSDIISFEKKFISVQFKNNEFYNFTHEKAIGYKYEMHRLVKLAWGKVEKNANPLYWGIKHFKFEEDDFRRLLVMYETSYSHKTIRQIACDWMKKSKNVWEMWKMSTKKPVLHIGGIFPITQTSYNGGGITRGARQAVKAINANSSILQDYELRLLASDGRCSPDIVMKKFIDFIIDRDYFDTLVGVLGPSCSETVEPIAGVSKHFHVMVISYSAEGASFSDRQKYPYFFRTIGENQHYKHVYLSLFEHFGWKKVAALTEDGQKYTEYISLMHEDFEKHKIKFIANKKFPRERSTEDMQWYLEDLKSRNARIIIADVVDDVARTVMCQAYKLDMTAKQGYVWFLPVWLNSTWYDTDYFNMNRKDIINCTTKDMLEAIKGYFAMTYAYYAADNNMMQENITVGEWREKYSDVINGSVYAGFAYDAVWTYALALDTLAKSDPEALSALHSERTTNKLVSLVEATDFHGVSGRIKFRGGPSRFSNMKVVQWYDNETHVVGLFYPNLTDDKPEILGGVLKLNESAIRWFTEDGKVPEDGTLPPPSCAVEGLARAFNVECQTAVIILNIIVAGVLIIGVIAVCFYMRRKYQKKVEKTKNYMRALGFPFDISHANDLDKWEILRERVVINRKLGEGAFGMVYGGEADLPETGWTAIAVKTLKVGSTTEEKLDFLSEAEAMKRFDHKNIVKLLGVCTKEEPVYTIMEFMLYGDLKTYLLARRHLVKTKNIEESEEVSSKRLTNMALDVARGLSYLAEMKFVHRDIASRNCLVNAQRCVKIGDFGMTRAMFDNDYYKFTRKGMLPVRWMSPESLALGVFTPSSDVWSFGVLLYEIITFGSFPFQGKSNAQVLELVKDGQILDIPKAAKPQLVALIKSCWKREPKERPTASQMVEFLATNPRLLSPCLDVPISSVQIEDTDQLDMSHRKDLKVSPSKSTNGSTFQAPSSLFDDRNERDCIPLEICCPEEPLLGPARSSSNLRNLSRLVGSRRDSEVDEYVDQNLTDRQENTIV